MTDAVAIRAALRGILDPETGRDLVAMGLIYGVAVEDGVAHVAMTATTRGCPLAETLRLGVAAVVGGLPGIRRAEVTLTFDPPWSIDRLEG